MRTIEVKLYLFDELSSQAQQKAVESLSIINVNHDWWDATYEDAKNIGLEIEGFELDRSKNCSGKLTYSLSETANLILENHGEKCETNKIAKRFLNLWSELVSKFSDGVNTEIVLEKNECEFDELADELESQFEKELLNEYADMLQRESDYLMTEEAIIETIEANEYEFTEDGTKY